MSLFSDPRWSEALAHLHRVGEPLRQQRGPS